MGSNINSETELPPPGDYHEELHKAGAHYVVGVIRGDEVSVVGDLAGEPIELASVTKAMMGYVWLKQMARLGLGLDDPVDARNSDILKHLFALTREVYGSPKAGLRSTLLSVAGMALTQTPGRYYLGLKSLTIRDLFEGMVYYSRNNDAVLLKVIFDKALAKYFRTHQRIRIGDGYEEVTLRPSRQASVPNSLAAELVSVEMLKMFETAGIKEPTLIIKDSSRDKGEFNIATLEEVLVFMRYFQQKLEQSPDLEKLQFLANLMIAGSDGRDAHKKGNRGIEFFEILNEPNLRIIEKSGFWPETDNITNETTIHILSVAIVFKTVVAYAIKRTLKAGEDMNEVKKKLARIIVNGIYEEVFPSE